MLSRHWHNKTWKRGRPVYCNCFVDEFKEGIIGDIEGDMIGDMIGDIEGDTLGRLPRESP